MDDKSKQFILWFDQLAIEDVPLVGGKNASLGEMYRELTPKGVRIPNGFAITAYAYRYLLEKAGVVPQLKQILSDLNTKNLKNLAKRADLARKAIRKAEFPKELKVAIAEAYRNLCKQYGKNTDVAVRSSATAEDLPDASFAGQQETYLNIRGEKALLEACKNCFASLFTDRAISYRVDRGFDHFSIALSIGVQKMVRSDLACSGVMFSIDTETGFRNAVLINGSWGLGENIVQGSVNPDEFYCFKPALKSGKFAVISKALGTKRIKMVYSKGKKPTVNIKTKKEEQEQFVLSDKEIQELARWGLTIEEYYSQKAGKFKPMDMEWAKDGQQNKLYIVQARPETVQAMKDQNVMEEYVLEQKGQLLATGHSVGQKIGTGKARVIKSVKEIGQVRKGDVIVTEMTDPDWEPVMKIASAIVTNRGGRTCFAGDTKILTEYGFMTMAELYERGDGLRVPSLNRSTMEVEWKSITAVMKQRAPVIEIATSLTGRQTGNTLRLTPNHKMITLEERKLVDREISTMLERKDHLLVAGRLPAITQSTQRQQQLAYLLGAISTDGHVRLDRRHGEVTFIQKPTPEKEQFIAAVVASMEKSFNKKVLVRQKPLSQGTIRGKPVQGSANSYRWFGKQVAEELLIEQQQMVPMLLNADTDLAYQFLAGVIDGDGTYNAKTHRINIYCSKQWLLEGVLVACLRVGIVPQVTRNRHIANVQIIEKLEELGKYTQRIKPSGTRKRVGERFFAARQLLGDIVPQVNRSGRILPYVSQNLLISTERLAADVLPNAGTGAQQEIKRLLESDLRQQRASMVRELGVQDVYNITVAGNHNYLVFSDRYTPLVVNNCHAAIVSRELGIPCVVGTENGTAKIKAGQPITVSCAEGDAGFVYKGALKFRVEKRDLRQLPNTKTKIMVNIGNPDQAFATSFLPVRGVGLAREEFIINSSIKIHPNALLQFNKLKDKKLKARIEELTKGYKNKTQYYVDKLAEGIARIAAAFHPHDVILRFSDFKSNEYANLIGGMLFEPKEANPMIGWRGASRYYDPKFADAFGLECKAVKKVRDDMGLTNVIVMIPVCRTVEEGKRVLETMAKYQLRRGENGLKVYAMCEIPSNVILAKPFLEIFDGFSIGSNDLTQMTLGVDRDSELVAHIYDERNNAVKAMVKQVIGVANQHGKYIGICGQAPSDHPDFAEFLVQCGIQSISLNPDSVVRTILKIAEAEQKYRHS